MSLLPIRLPPGADLRRSLEAIASRDAASGAFVLSGMGSLSDPRLRFAGQEHATTLPGEHEILTLTGGIADGIAHLHMSVADASGKVVGGHVVEGNVVRTTVEVLLQAVPGWRLSRGHDPATGYRELVVHPAPTTSVTDAGPRLLAAIPKLASLDIGRSLAFFEGLGFRRLGQYPDYGLVERDGIQIHFWLCNDPRIPKETACRVTVQDIEALHADYAAMGVIHPNGSLERKPWGVHEFSILDPDGNLVTFQQPA